MDCDLSDDPSSRPSFDISESDKDLEDPAAFVNPIPANGTTNRDILNNPKKKRIQKVYMG